jgi:hypothetical protein
MAATTRTTSATPTNREHLVVTRHALRSLHAETTSFRPMPRYVPLAKIRAKAKAISRSDLPIDGPPDEKSRSSGHRRLHRDAPATITAGWQNNKSP